MPPANAPTFDAKRAWKDVLKHVAQEFSSTKPKVVSRYMPRWWSESLLRTRADYLEALLLLAGGLQIPAARLEELQSPLVPNEMMTRCKGSSPEREASQLPARQAAEALARNLVGLLDHDEQPTVMDALDLRERLIGRDDIIRLDGLLRLCWELNVPVAHLHDSPQPKPDAIATNVDGRCAIVLLNNRAHCGWHLFDVAHELGHIMLGHLHPGESICDEGGTDFSEEHEREANDFAIALLTGQRIPVGYEYFVTADKLREVAVEASATFKVDPQWLIVTTGKRWNSGDGWTRVMKALKDGWPDDDASSVVLAELKRQLWQREVGTSREDAILALTSPPRPVEA